MNRGAPPALFVALILLSMGSGCIGLLEGDDEARLEPSNRTIPAEGRTGSTLVVDVVDVAQIPLEAAEVTVAVNGTRSTAETDKLGTASFPDLQGSQALVHAQAPGYQQRSISVALPGHGEVRETLVLTPVATIETFVEAWEFEGFFECSATYLIITGDCLAVVRAVADEAGAWPGQNATNERFTFPFDLRPGWRSLSITQTWQEAAAGTGSMMRVNLEPIDRNNTEGHGQRYARAEGSSPITLSLENDGAVHPTASGEEMVLPEEGATVRTRTFHLGLEEAHNPGGTEFLGAGVALQQTFTVYVNVTYGG